MIKVFTSGASPELCGRELTQMYESWVAKFAPNTIRIINIHTNSNKWGWMLVVHYKIVG